MYKKFLEKSRKAIVQWGMFEWSVFKLTVCLFGIAICTYFVDFFTKYIKVIWIVFAIGMLYMIYLLFAKKYEDNKKEEEKQDNGGQN